MKTISSVVSIALLALSPLTHADLVIFDLEGKGGFGLLPANENQPTVSTATGGLFGEGIFFDTDTNLLTVNFAWGSDFGFMDLTSEVFLNAAGGLHLHGPADFFSNNGIVVFLDPAVETGITRDVDGLSGFASGTVMLDDDAERWLLADELYINLHTDANRPGELRANLTVVPEPSSLALLLLPLGLLLVALRRRKVS